MMENIFVALYKSDSGMSENIFLKKNAINKNIEEN